MIHIGISGWLYPWRGNFYPKGLPQRRELEFASRAFNTLEINGTFYSLQRPTSFRRRHDGTPDDFVFAVKGRFITHMKKLDDIEQPLATFFAQGLLALGRKLGPILWQFPERQAFDEAKIANFLALLPRDTEAAAARRGGATAVSWLAAACCERPSIDQFATPSRSQVLPIRVSWRCFEARVLHWRSLTPPSASFRGYHHRFHLRPIA